MFKKNRIVAFISDAKKNKASLKYPKLFKIIEVDCAKHRLFLEDIERKRSWEDERNFGYYYDLSHRGDLTEIPREKDEQYWVEQSNEIMEPKQAFNKYKAYLYISIYNFLKTKDPLVSPNRIHWDKDHLREFFQTKVNLKGHFSHIVYPSTYDLECLFSGKQDYVFDRAMGSLELIEDRDWIHVTFKNPSLFFNSYHQCSSCLRDFNHSIYIGEDVKTQYYLEAQQDCKAQHYQESIRSYVYIPSGKMGFFDGGGCELWPEVEDSTSNTHVLNALVNQNYTEMGNFAYIYFGNTSEEVTITKDHKRIKIGGLPNKSYTTPREFKCSYNSWDRAVRVVDLEETYERAQYYGVDDWEPNEVISVPPGLYELEDRKMLERKALKGSYCLPQYFVRAYLRKVKDPEVENRFIQTYNPQAYKELKNLSIEQIYVAYANYFAYWEISPEIIYESLERNLTYQERIAFQLKASPTIKAMSTMSNSPLMLLFAKNKTTPVVAAYVQKKPPFDVREAIALDKTPGLSAGDMVDTFLNRLVVEPVEEFKCDFELTPLFWYMVATFIQNQFTSLASEYKSQIESHRLAYWLDVWDQLVSKYPQLLEAIPELTIWLEDRNLVLEFINSRDKN